MIRIPPEAEVPSDQRASAPIRLRYEDVSQDGRVMLESLPHGIGESVWAKLLARHPVSRVMREQGVVPILTRLKVESYEGPVSVSRPLEAHGSYQLAHTIDVRGEVDRLVLSMWVRVSGTISRTHGKHPRDGEPIEVGRVFAEHVFTRPFGAAADRKVLRFEFEGLPDVPTARYEWHDPAEMLMLPESATPFEPDVTADAASVAFGISHTDSNQHVNSLVYPRMFEEAVLRRLSSLGKPTALLSRAFDVAYRKPCFAGDRVRLSLRTFALGDHVGALGVFTADDAAQKPHCFLRMRFEA